ncbi:MAG: AAA family ATPase [Actinomycetota bacterium]|nr:AAA family ATPase [Actinomycetota bacterium]
MIVRNLGIIEEAHIEPGAGLVVVTGETGAGKTMLLGALRLLMGTASRRESVGPFGDESVVDGRFMFESDDEVTIRRRVTSEGRSKAYVDGSMVPAKALQERTGGRIEVVGQHDHMLLATPSGARRLVDSALSPAGRKAEAAYTRAWQELVVTRQKLELLGGGRRELERELEVVRYQAEEITGSGFKSGDDSEMKARAARLRNSEDLAVGLDAALSALGDDAATGHLGLAAGELRRLGRVDETLGDLSKRLEELLGGIGEVQLEVASVAASLEHDPAVLDALETRIQKLGELRRKYGETLDEVLTFGSQAETRAAELTGLLGTADDLAAELDEKTAVAAAAAKALTGQRLQAGKRLESDAVAHLQELGMSRPVVRLAMSDVDLGPDGADRIELSFASDSGLTPGPAAKVASGGELSRLTLALRLAAGIGDAGLVAFDEVDAGIGGATALAMGEKLSTLSNDRQIFCVTHLPQVAAHADTHLVVERDGAKASVRVVAGDDRLAELSRMLGGLPHSERGQLHAAELLESARRA